MSKYNYNLLKEEGDSVIIKLPKKDVNINGRPQAETKARTAAKVYAINNGFKVSCKKQDRLLFIKRV